MAKHFYASPLAHSVVIAACWLAVVHVGAQNPPANPNPAPPAAAGQTAQHASNADNAWLAKTRTQYYSSAKAGLTGFDCDVHPDWHELFVSANKDAQVAEDDPRITLLKTVKVTLHARMKGASTIDWVANASPDKPLDDASTQLLDGMHQSVQQTLEGFLQFWGPFMEASVVPDTADGVEITHGATAHTIHAKQGATELTEVFNGDLVLEQFNVSMNGTSIKFAPDYKPTPHGLIVYGFVAHILPQGAQAGQEQEMRVGIEYQEMNGLTIPSRLTMDVVGTGNFNFTFDGCATNPK